MASVAGAGHIQLIAIIEQESALSLQDWMGRHIDVDGALSSDAVRGSEATLHSRVVAAEVGSAAPLLAHWLAFHDFAPLDQLGADGHPKLGGFLPPVPLPRRMWAGSQLVFHRPLRVGIALRRRSTIGSVVEKTGRTGKLVFVRVDHEVYDGDGLVLTDSQDIVYREAAATGTAPAAHQPAPSAFQWSRSVHPDPVLLFRYSALTFNGHRIHYDRDYARTQEGYPGLVVHGPMIATLLLHEMQRAFPGVDVAGFTFRAVNPIFDSGTFKVCGTLDEGGTAQLFASDESGALCMTATATLR